MVGTFSDARPLGDVHNGLVRVDFINNRGGSDGYGFLDTTGKIVLRGKSSDFQNDFSCGVTQTTGCTIIDTKGNVVIPGDQFCGYSPNGFQDDLCLAYARSNDAAYLLEIHQGVYSGPGRVYGASQPTTPVQPEQPTQPEQPVTPAAKTASPTNDKLTVDGTVAVPAAYKIEGSNYFKIRDMAALLNGTNAQFSVGYDNAAKSVTLTTGESYELQADDLAGVPTGGNQAAISSNDVIYINGVKAELTVYKVGGSNYFKLRDLGQALGFSADWSKEAGMMIDTSKPYSE